MKETRTTPDWIVELGPDEVFVFGSNMSGRHGKGAAKMAMKWGAIYGQAAGIQGRTYGIPTVNASITGKLHLDKIERFVGEFVDYAIHHPSKTFLVTEVGCGLAGWTVKDIAPLFESAAMEENIHLPLKFWRILQHTIED